MGFPILYANKNQVYYIDKIKLLDDMTRHFASLGFVNGEKVKIVSNNGGDLIVEVKGTRIAIDKKTANKIFVTEQENNLDKQKEQ